ncbi:MAG: tRNA lysidine(34) synthetase TilS, partial [Lachnospiraceae bacterium]|nr:tRNA lysidine(34) synthetase TilS [Lachnospiraceae bacterium]
MGNTSEMLMETEDFVKQETRRAYDVCVAKTADGVRIDIERMKAFHSLIRKWMILQSLEELIPARRDITAVHVRKIEELTEKEGNPRISLPGGVCVRREYGNLVFERQKHTAAKERACAKGQKEAPEWTVRPEPACEIELPGLGTLCCRVFSCEKNADIPQNRYTKWFDYDKIKESLKIRTRRTGDYLTINKALSRKSLQDYMVNTRIPRQERDSMWLLADGEHILWVIGYRISEAYKVAADTKRVLEVQLRGGQEDGGTY